MVSLRTYLTQSQGCGESTCNFIALASVRSISLGNCTPTDLFVDDHVRHHFPTRPGSIDQNLLNKPHQPTRH